MNKKLYAFLRIYKMLTYRYFIPSLVYSNDKKPADIH